MNKIKTIFIFFLIITSICFASDIIPNIDSTDIPGAKITLTRYFDGNSLWGYIDGGADLYLEYGFIGLQVQSIEWKKNKFTLNTYHMSDSEAAFGIFSIHKFNCEYADNETFIICAAPYQVQILHKDLYISIVNNSGSIEAQNVSLDIAKLIAEKFNSTKSINIPSVFTNYIFEPYLSNLKYFRGILGLQNGAPEWSDKFEKFKGYSIYYLPIDDSSSSIISLVKFGNNNDLKLFLEQSGFSKNNWEPGQVYQHSGNGKADIIKIFGTVELLILESDKKPDGLEKYISVIKNSNSGIK